MNSANQSLTEPQAGAAPGERRQKSLYHLPAAVCLIIIAILFFLPTGFEGALIYTDAEHCAARVLEADNSRVLDTGLVRSGEQTCTLEILGGRYKGQILEGFNMLNGSLEQDKIFAAGDKAQVVIHSREGQVTSVSMIDHYRISKELLLALAFGAFLIFFAGQTGLRAILSFILTVLAFWKILVPVYLQGANPIWVGLAATALLTILIISLVYGFDRRALSAISGAMLGILVTCLLGILCTDQFQIHGAVMAYSESLLYSGYPDLNLTQIFMAGIFIGSSGAMMDLAVDITSAVHEVIEKKPTIGWREATRSGMNVGRAAMGTMTTTLLLAYSGGYIALLMVFMAQGTPLSNILNYKYVAAEIADTLVGSFGLVLVAPFTALTSGWLLTRGRKDGIPAAKKAE